MISLSSKEEALHYFTDDDDADGSRVGAMMGMQMKNIGPTPWKTNTRFL